MYPAFQKFKSPSCFALPSACHRVLLCVLVSSNCWAVYVGRNFAPLHTVRWGVLVSCCLLSGLPASSVQSHCRIQNCAAHLLLKRCKTDHITPLFQFLHWLPIQQRIQYKINTVCYKCITGTALLCLISGTVFNLTRPPVLSAPILILSASRFLAPDSTVGSSTFSVFSPSTWNDLPFPLQ